MGEADKILRKAGWNSGLDGLLGSAKALLSLDKDGSLVPHGIGGHARKIIESFIKIHDRRPKTVKKRSKI